MSDNILNTPGLMDPSTELGNMMQTAMKIKSSQMEQQRKVFETWPSFLQNTLWMQGPALELREQPVDERLQGAKAIKEEGNGCFHLKVSAASYHRRSLIMPADCVRALPAESGIVPAYSTTQMQLRSTSRR